MDFKISSMAYGGIGGQGRRVRGWEKVHDRFPGKGGTGCGLNDCLIGSLVHLKRSAALGLSVFELASKLMKTNKIQRVVKHDVLFISLHCWGVSG
jgi:hypothetical protein